MPHLVGERGARSALPPPAKESRGSSRNLLSGGGALPESDLLKITYAGIVYRLTQFGLDPNAGPLLVSGKPVLISGKPGV